MPSDSENLFKKFAGHVKYINYTRIKSENLLKIKKIVERDINFIYSGLFIDMVTSFEYFIEELFFGLLTKRFIIKSEFKPLVVFNRKDLCKSVICAGRQYTEWLPYDKTIGKAKIYFENGYPFTRITNQQAQNLQEVATIRNALAHKSEFSQDKFLRMLNSMQYLTTPEKKPIGFLRGAHTTSPVIVTRYEHYMKFLFGVGKKITD